MQIRIFTFYSSSIKGRIVGYIDGLEANLHSTLVLLNGRSLQRKRARKAYLHSTLVLLKVARILGIELDGDYLHSTLVLLKAT